MTWKRKVLGTLKQRELQFAVRVFDLNAGDLRLQQGLIDCLARSKVADLESILVIQKRDVLKRICRDLQIDDSGKKNSDIINRIVNHGAAASSHPLPLSAREPTPRATAAIDPIALSWQLKPAIKQRVQKRYDELIEAFDQTAADQVKQETRGKVSMLALAATRWIRDLAHYSGALLAAFEDDNLDGESRRVVGAALQYLLIIDDVIPDHHVGDGFLDDAYVVNLCLARLNRSARDLISVRLNGSN